MGYNIVRASKGTMRFEAVHQYFKRAHHAIHNHINLTYSLAMRHQRLKVYHLMSNCYFEESKLGSLLKLSVLDLNTIEE